MEAKQKESKMKRVFGNKSEARARWPIRLALVWAILRAEFAVIGDQL